MKNTTIYTYVPERVQEFLCCYDNKEAVQQFNSYSREKQLDVLDTVYNLGGKNLAKIKRESNDGGSNFIYHKVTLLSTQDKHFVHLVTFELTPKVVTYLDNFWYCQRINAALNEAVDKIVSGEIEMPRRGIDFRDTYTRFRSKVKLPELRKVDYVDIARDLLAILEKRVQIAKEK